MRKPGEPVYQIFRGSDVGAPVYRVVERCPPRAEDFRSYAESGPAFPSRMRFRATGVSMYAQRRAARQWVPRHGRSIAQLDLSDPAIYMAHVEPPAGHLVVWATPSELLGCVLACEAVERSAATTVAFLVVDDESGNILHASGTTKEAEDVYRELVSEAPGLADRLAVVRGERRRRRRASPTP